MFKMKKFFYLCMIALGCMVGFTSCGSDDDDEPNTESGEARVVNSIIEDKGNIMTLTVTVTERGLTATLVTTCEFDGQTDDALCIRAEQKSTFPNEEWARKTWEEEYNAADKASGKMKLNGNTITQDLTEDFKDFTKLEAKYALEYSKALIESQYGKK